ncbi:RIP metalloprotease RseP, partial [Enterococcus faecalis]
WQRAAIVAAGPAINFLFAILILAAFAFLHGESRTPAVAGMVQPGSAAAMAGIQPGDRIVSLNGRAMSTFDDIRLYAQSRPGEPVTILLDRKGHVIEKQGHVGAVSEDDGFGNKFRIGRLGIAPGEPVIEPVSLLRAPVVAIERTGQIIRTMVET